MNIKTNDVPAPVLVCIKEHYNYEVETRGKDLVFNANGKFLKELTG